MHLRWHYQLFILSGGYLLGAFLSSELNLKWFLIQFVNVHLLLFGGATAYNSFWDKDEGPIGGLKHPPQMKRWMWLASILLQLIGLMLAIPMGSLFLSIYALSMFLFWLYSTPLARWKARPIKSLFAIGVSTGFNSVLLGFLAAGNRSLNAYVLLAALGVAAVLLSLYPVSQVYQRKEDIRRGDQTFTLQYGIGAVFQFFLITYFAGLLLIAIIIMAHHFFLGLVFGLLGVLTGLYGRAHLRHLSTDRQDYGKVMLIKYATSLAFVIFLITGIVLKHFHLWEYLPP